MDVLVAEDNVANQLLIKALCEAAGVAVTIACDGAEALEAVQKAAYDLVLMDVQMPTLDGIAGTIAIRALPGPAAKRLIIGLTADTSEETRAACLAAGMTEVVSKPIQPAKLAAILATARGVRNGTTEIPSPDAVVPISPVEKVDTHLASMDAQSGPTAAGRLHYLDLAKVREKLGARWEKVATRIEWMTERIIGSHLQKGDIFSKNSTLDYTIMFPSVSYEEGTLRCLAICREISAKLFGEDGEGLFELSASTTKLGLGAAGPPVTNFSALYERLVSEPALDLAAAPVASSASEAARDPFSDLAIVFDPMWDTEKKRYPMHGIRAVFGATPGARAGEDPSRLDIATVQTFARSLDGYDKLTAPALLALPVHFETLAKTLSRLEYIANLDRLPVTVRKRLVVAIAGLPNGIPSLRLAEITAPVASRCLNVGITTDLSFRNIAAAIDSNIRVIVVSCTGLREDDAESVAKIRRFAGNAKKSRLILCLSEVTSAKLAEALKPHFRYLSGPGIAPAKRRLDEPIGHKIPA